MRIEYERSGGFTGMQLSAHVDTDDLPCQDAALLESAVATADLARLPRRLASDVPGADRFHYHLAVEQSGERYEIDVGEAALPDSLRPLIGYLSRLARTGRLR